MTSREESTMAIIFIITQFVAISLSQVTATIEAPSGYVLHKDSDCSGFDLSGLNLVTSVQECADICDQADGCVGFVIDQSLSLFSICWIKFQCEELLPSTDTDTYKKVEASVSSYISHKDSDCAGHDFIGVRIVTTVKECEDICDQTEGCVGFVVDLRLETDINCWVKNYCVHFTTLTDVDTYTKDLPPLDYILSAENWNCFEMSTNTVRTIRECAAICDQTEYCEAFSLNGDTTDNCVAQYICSDWEGSSGIDTYMIDTYIKETPPSDYTIHEDKDCGGNDFIGVNSVTKIQQCADICDQTNGCVGFVIDHRLTSTNCWVKNACGHLTHLTNVDTYKKAAETSLSGYISHRDSDCAGHDFIGVRIVTSVKVCKDICDQIEGCVGFVVDLRLDTDINCWVKNYCVHFTTLKDVDTYTKADLPPLDYILSEDKHCLDMSTNTVRTIRECAAICDQTEYCEAFSFNGDTTDNCVAQYICSDSEGSSGSSGIDTYMKDSPPQGYVYKANKDCGGNDFIGVNSVTTTQQCADICDETERCVGFVIDHRLTSTNCWVKNICNDLVHLEDVDTYEKVDHE